MLLVTKSALIKEQVHAIDVYQYSTLRLVKELMINPVIEQQIPYQMNRELYDNNALDEQNNFEPELTGP